MAPKAHSQRERERYTRERERERLFSEAYFQKKQKRHL